MVPFIALLAGLLFGIGLIMSGMADPAKVLGFLDIAGLWDPSLAFVMGGALVVSAIAFLLVRRRNRSILGLPMNLPATTAITPRLLLGSAAFGVGWGLAGFCPGPGLVAAGAGIPKGVVFAAAMVAGMALFEFFERRRAAMPQQG